VAVAAIAVVGLLEVSRQVVAVIKATLQASIDPAPAARVATKLRALAAAMQTEQQ
jgi:hypothetical protein